MKYSILLLLFAIFTFAVSPSLADDERYDLFSDPAGDMLERERYNDPFANNGDDDYFIETKQYKDDRYIDTQKKPKSQQLDTWGRKRPASSEQVLRGMMQSR